MKGIKKLILWVCLGGGLYLLMSYHFIFFGKNCKILKKSELTLNNTFFSARGTSNESLLSIDVLREAGIADILVEVGRITEKEKRSLMALYDEEFE
jgi:hypothetical protein